MVETFVVVGMKIVLTGLFLAILCLLNRILLSTPFCVSLINPPADSTILKPLTVINALKIHNKINGIGTERLANHCMEYRIKTKILQI